MHLFEFILQMFWYWSLLLHKAKWNPIAVEKLQILTSLFNFSLKSTCKQSNTCFSSIFALFLCSVIFSFFLWFLFFYVFFTSVTLALATLLGIRHAFLPTGRNAWWIRNRVAPKSIPGCFILRARVSASYRSHASYHVDS